MKKILILSMMIMLLMPFALGFTYKTPAGITITALSTTQAQYEKH